MWWENGSRRSRTLGRKSQMTKTQAQKELAAMLAPVNAFQGRPSGNRKFDPFVKEVYLRFYKRKWKRSTPGSIIPAEADSRESCLPEP